MPAAKSSRSERRIRMRISVSIAASSASCFVAAGPAVAGPAEQLQSGGLRQLANPCYTSLLILAASRDHDPAIDFADNNPPAGLAVKNQVRRPDKIRRLS